MKKTGFVSLLLLFGLLLGACGGENHENHSGSELNFDPLDVEIIAPDEADPHEEIVIQALVTQGDEKVNDASEVVFEIWQRGQKEDSEMVEAELTNEDGVYEIRYTFTEENLYHIQPHVTARGMHMMPVSEIAIGNVPEIEEQGEQEYEEHDHGHDSDHHSHDLPDELHVEWQTLEETNHDETELTVYVEHHGEPLIGGSITFEVWQHGDEMHQWLQTEESTPGSYTVFHTFLEDGDYHIIIHIESEDLHEHVDQSIKVISR